MKRYVSALAAAILVMGGAGGTAGAAHADSTPPVDVLSAISNASPASLSGVATVVSSDADSAVTDSNSGIAIDVPVDPSTPLSLSGGASGTPLVITLPQATTADNAKPVSGGIVSYDNNNGSTTVPLVKTDGSLQIDTVISNAAAPSSYSYGLSVPAGGVMSQDDAGAISVVDDSGNLVAGISPAWARDAGGRSVPTHFVISGFTVTQVVDLSAADIAYPVVADPWLWRDTIDHTTWSYAVPGDARLQVFPTGWGRTWSGSAVWGEQWGEVLKKTSQHKDWANTNEMKWQFECHLALGANLWKSSYNLDTINRRGSLASYITHKCN